MSYLKVTLIDVGWGDSILLESQNDNDELFFALIDSNDSSYMRSSHIFLKRYFEKQGYDIPSNDHLFEWMMLSHIHSDHGKGLKPIMKSFGAKSFWYPKSEKSAVFFSDLLTYSNRSNRVEAHQAIDKTKTIPNFGNVKIKVLWPKADVFDPNENNNSIVLLLTLNDVSVVLSGDAEIEVWEEISNLIPDNTMFFKAPHHGSSNGMFDDQNNTPWLDKLNDKTVIGISSHIKPFSHPSPNVIHEIENTNRAVYRTDEDYHLTFWTDGTETAIKYSHYDG